MATQLPYWETIEYIGGGYVLQKKMAATLNSDKNSIEKREAWLDRDTKQKKKTYNRRGKNRTYAVDEIQQVESVHRIVHAAELNGVDTDELTADAVARFGSEMEL